MSNWKSQQIQKRLKLCGISKGVWIDAGCGHGTFTFPLSMLVSRVIAIDQNPSDINYLKSHISMNDKIELKIMDFQKNEPLYHELVDGVLFAFSLHYHADVTNALKNAFNQLKPFGLIIIIEYSKNEAAPWIPFPLPRNKITALLDELGFKNIITVLELKPSRRYLSWNNASYVLKAERID